MSIYNQIRDAVENTRLKFQSGIDINDAVIESTNGFTKEAVKRVVEEINVKNFLNVLEGGEDRSQEFPLADTAKIFEKISKDTMAGTDIVDIVEKDVPGMDFYQQQKTAELKSIPDLPMEKCAKKDISHISIDFVMAKREAMEKRAESYGEMIEHCERIMAYNLEKVASNLYGKQEKADEVFRNLRVKNSSRKPYRPVIDLIKSIEKLANVKHCRDIFSPNYIDVESDNFVDDRNQDFNMCDQFIRAMDTRAQLIEKYSSEQEKIEKINDFLFEKLGLKKKAKEKKAAIGGIAKSFGKGFWGKKAPKGLWGWAAPKGYGETVQKGLTGILTKVPTGAKTFELAKIYGQSMAGADISGKVEEELSVGELYTQKIKQKEVFEDLVEHDELLREQDPALLAKLFESLTELAPNVATRKEVVRSFLRQISSQAEPTIDPFYATQLIKLDRVISGQGNITLG